MESYGKMEVLIAEHGTHAVLHIFRDGTEIATMTGSPDGVRRVVREQFGEVKLNRINTKRK